MLEIILLCGLAALAANLPFLSDRVGFVLPPDVLKMNFGWRLLELVLLYLAVGVVARVLEARVSTVQPQHWWFYVATAALFIVMAWPGFVWRYFWRKPGL
ncbi:DUF2818 family protein [Silvimonas iriomotensis]|uniref:Membrane protein n=1 Tax=Silvimonas iriomotensis TaxID=449662 RepID=A0ABQ2PCS5_9NEIS|nr:DUF2818 family protein [Silvimonas iriomotensis]GGP23300.1 membrane protein [Silvimonas iriomotensis]